jgi:hypothetical protein
VEDAGTKYGCSDSDYCENGKPKSTNKDKKADKVEAIVLPTQPSKEKEDGITFPTEKCTGLDVTNCINYDFEITDSELYFWSNTLYVVAAVEGVISIILAGSVVGTPGAIWLFLEGLETAYQGTVLSAIADQPGDYTEVISFFSDEYGPLLDFFADKNGSSASGIFMPINRVVNWAFSSYYQSNGG